MKTADNNTSSTNTNNDFPEKSLRVSKIAVTSLILGVFGFLIPVIISIPGLILGILGLRKIRNSKYLLKGRGLAISGIIVSGISLTLWLIPIMFLSVSILYMKLSAPKFEKTGGYTILCEVGNGEQLSKSTLEEVCVILKKRLDPVGYNGIIIQHKEKPQVKIFVPVIADSNTCLDNPEDIKHMLKGSGRLEFRILATMEDSNFAELQTYQAVLSEKGSKLASDNRYVWCEIEKPDEWTSNGVMGQFGEKTYVLCSNQKKQVLLHSSDKKWKLQNARPALDSQGRQAIGFTLDNVAANMFFRLTSENIDKPLCILIDGLALSAPNINCAIRSQGIITGQFTTQEIADMVNRLNAGALPVRVNPIDESITWITPTE